MPSTESGVAAVALVLALLVAGVGPPVAAERPDASQGCFPSFDGDGIERRDAVGDVVTVEFLHCFSGSVTVRGPGFNGTVEMGDGNHSGSATLRVNTREAGADALGVTSETLDDDELPTETTAAGDFTAGTYTVVLRDYGGDVVDRANVTLTDPAARDVVLWSAPPNASDDLDSVAAVRRSRAGADAVDDERPFEPDHDAPQLRLRTNHTLVVAVEAGGIEGAMATGNGTPLDRFRGAIRRSSGEFVFRQTPESTTPQRQPLRPPILNSSATHLVADAANDTYYLVVDTAELAGRWEGSHGGRVVVGVNPGMGYYVRLSMQGPVHEESPPEDVVAADFQVVDEPAQPVTPTDSATGTATGTDTPTTVGHSSTATGGATPTDEATPTATTARPPATTTTTPGFGTAVGLVALLAGASLLARR